MEAEEEIEKITDEKYIEEQARLEKERQESKSLHLFTFDNPLRVALNSILNNRNFEWIMIILIIINSIDLALDNPLNDPKSDLSYNIQYVDYALTVVFVIEAIAKIIAQGFYNCGNTSYILNSWNILDFFVVIITVS